MRTEVGVSIAGFGVWTDPTRYLIFTLKRWAAYLTGVFP